MPHGQEIGPSKTIEQITRDVYQRKQLVEMELISLDEIVRHVMRGMRSRNACGELPGVT